MQATILLITLLVMMGTLAIILRAVLAVDGPAPSPNVNQTRVKFLWGMDIVGVVISIASLREWPHAAPGTDAMVINITSGQWWRDTDTTEIPLGQQVEFRVTSEDVNHGLGIYNDEMRLLVQVQAMPNYTNSIVYTFDEPGTYQILCMEFCGIAHHDMTYEFEVQEASS